MKSITKNFAKYVSLNIFGMIGMSLYILVDTFFIAKVSGVNGIASLNYALVMFSIMFGIGHMCGVGGGTLFSINKGTKGGKGDTSFTHSIFIATFFSALFIIVAISFITPLSKFLGASGETLPITVTYLRTVLLFAPAFIFNNTLSAFVRNDNNPTLSMTALLFSSFLNIILDYILMFEFGLGIFGAALATGISAVSGIIVLLTHFFRNKANIGLVKCKISFNTIRHLCSLGLSALITELASAVSLYSFNMVILKISGNTGVAAYGVIANVAIVVTSVFTGINAGMQPLSSKAYGQNKISSVKHILKLSLLTAFSVSALSIIVAFCFSTEISNLFNSERNIDLQNMAEPGIRIYFLGYLFAGFNMISAAFLSSVNRAKSGMAISISRSFFVLIPSVIILSQIFGMTGVWFAFPVCELLVFIISIIQLVIFNKNYKLNLKL